MISRMSKQEKGPGRKPFYPKGERGRFIFVCRKEDRERWIEKAESQGVSLGEVIRQLLEKWEKRA